MPVSRTSSRPEFVGRSHHHAVGATTAHHGCRRPVPTNLTRLKRALGRGDSCSSCASTSSAIPADPENFRSFRRVKDGVCLCIRVQSNPKVPHTKFRTQSRTNCSCIRLWYLKFCSCSATKLFSVLSSIISVQYVLYPVSY